ncbi:S8 family serine peptidase [Pararcticibacter amylolyticus]|uniref:Peptidase S8 n=1 Tax=Pararcticibacter amylolyticus TaxID=2173175 RepID=A0A2U2PFZ8_9SPHI|nr:S8 family serine peptidase [Pararcticibacter amylolyticus]PWG80192.1 peptidase S8 [Pararcticibacter amylolyticus]
MNPNKLIILLGCCFLTSAAISQQKEKPGPDWQLKDLKADGVFGVSMEKTYKEIIKKKKLPQVCVAVIDGGIDIEHEDLKNVIWTNPREIPANNKDDDSNGFVDDIHGWNFFGTMTEGDPEYDIRQLVQQIAAARSAGSDFADLQQKLDLLLRPEREKLKAAQNDKAALEEVIRRIGKAEPTQQDFRDFIPKNEAELNAMKDMVYGMKNIGQNYLEYRKYFLGRLVYQYQMHLDYYLNQDYDMKTSGPASFHGTHIAGILAAERNNGKGINGMASVARIMPVRGIAGIDPAGPKDAEMQLVMAGQEGSKSNSSLVQSIRYAVDNGAKVINMSLGQKQSLLSGKLLEAVNYALSKDVLIVHAAGNQGMDLDKAMKERAEGPEDSGKEKPVPDPANWIEVAASGWKNENPLAASFSNYGKNTVHVFAPGVEMYSTEPRSGYGTEMGTSQAAPVVAGLAVMLKAYYPRLTAPQLKEIIMKSVIPAEPLKGKCITGGVVNAYQAFKLAKKY